MKGTKTALSEDLSLGPYPGIRIGVPAPHTECPEGEEEGCEHAQYGRVLVPPEGT